MNTIQHTKRNYFIQITRTQKITIEHFLSGSNLTKFEKRKNAEIHVNGVEVVFFGIQNGKTQPFFKISTRTFLYIFIDKCPFTYIPFLTNKICSYKILENKFVMITFPKFPNFQKFLKLR